MVSCPFNHNTLQSSTGSGLQRPLAGVSVVCVGAIGRPAGVQACKLCGHGNGMDQVALTGARLLLRSVSAKFTE